MARPGLMRDGLYGLLSTISEINVVSTTTNWDHTLEYVKVHCPAIVILELISLKQKHLEAVQLMKDSCAAVKVVAIVNELNMDSELINQHIDVILPSGANPVRITEAVLTLVPSADQ